MAIALGCGLLLNCLVTAAGADELAADYHHRIAPTTSDLARTGRYAAPEIVRFVSPLPNTFASVAYLTPLQHRTFSGQAEPGGLLRPVAYSPGFAPAIATSFRPEIAPPVLTNRLSPAVLHVSQLAAHYGDSTFILVDKARGKLFVFENGRPIFTSAALTGSSLADRLPYDALGKTIAEASDLRYRVTPAGRFTVSPGLDRTYGNTLDINEIHGRNWIIAIHLAPSQRREARLASTLDGDKHATEGCINVDANTMRALTRLLATRRSTPLYIIPNDERMITQFF
jgi:hypothetical protein